MKKLSKKKKLFEMTLSELQHARSLAYAALAREQAKIAELNGVIAARERASENARVLDLSRTNPPPKVLRLVPWKGSAS